MPPGLRWSGRVHAVPISAAASSTARVDLSVAMGGWRAGGFIRGEPVDGLRGGQVGGNGRLESGGFIRCCRPRFAWAGLGQSSLLDALRSVSSLRPRCSATSLRLQPTPSNCCAWAVTFGVITVAPRVARGV